MFDTRVMASGPVWAQHVSSDDLRAVTGLQGRWVRYVAPSAENSGMVFGMGQLDPGEVAGPHAHPEPEIFLVLEGYGEAHWEEGGQAHVAELRPGVAFYKIGGVPHRMVNLGDGPLTGVFFKVS
jgi:quercetin dioxygenase-like cupin family protein